MSAGNTRKICLHAARAGTGKTTLAVNLAGRLAAQGKRVGLVDADFHAPGLHHFFFDEKKPPPARQTLNYFVWDDIRTLEPLVHEVHYGSLADPLWLLPASPHTEDITRSWREGYDVGLLVEALEVFSAARQLDYLFLDTIPGLSPTALHISKRCDLTLITVRPITQDTLATQQVINTLGSPTVLAACTVINMLPGYADNQDERARLQRWARREFRLRLATILPTLPAVPRLGDTRIYALDKADADWLAPLDAILREVRGDTLHSENDKHDEP